ncbi:MAG: hypothetical protein V2I26_19730 [Halieaceae bacterium]|jgi:hypothetical protein|nr:hypothetical protein [Halieaceae bacterium]
MSQTPILALTLFSSLTAVAYLRYRPNRNTGNDQQELRAPNPGETGAEFGERRLASAINEPGARNRLNDQVARLLAVLAATSFAIAIASRYLTS